MLIVPIENLGAIPFAALPVTKANDPLINFTTITVAPGLGIVHDASQSPRRTWKRALIVGDPDLRNDPKWIFPDLPGARREAIDVAALFGTHAVVGMAASEITGKRFSHGMCPGCAAKFVPTHSGH